MLINSHEALIKRIVAAENLKNLERRKTLHSVGDEGVVVARRTVAKYREQMNIGPSNEKAVYLIIETTGD